MPESGPASHALNQRMMGPSTAPSQGFGQCMLGPSGPAEAYPHAPSPVPQLTAPPVNLGFGPTVVNEHLTIEGPPPPHVADLAVHDHAMGQSLPPMGQPLPPDAAVNALQVQKYGGNTWSAPRTTGTAAAPAMLANGLAEAQMARVMSNLPMPKYSGSPEDLDEFERTWNKYVADSTMGCSEAQRQRFCLAMLPHCVPSILKKELDDWVEDGRVSTWDEMWRAFRKEEVADLPHHAQRRFKAVRLRTQGGHIQVADWREFRREYRHLRRYVEDWTEESEAARVYDMLPYK